MKRNKIKRVLALVLAGIMVMAMFAGCGKEETNSSADSGKNSSTTTTGESKPAEGSNAGVDETTAAGMEGWEAFADQVTLKVPVYDRSKEGYPAVDDNYWTQWIQSEFGDKWNIDVEFVAIPRGDVMTKYSLLIAAGDTPTIMMEYDYPKVAQWATDGAMQPIDLDAFAHVAPTYYQKMVDNNQLGYSTINGDTYFVLSERPYYNAGYTYYTFVRKDWLDAVGLDVPTTYEEYVTALDAIVAAGLTDQPLGMQLPSSAYVTNFAFRDYPVDEAEWAMHSSLGTASLSWEPTKGLLKRLNSEYNKGYYSTEYDLDVDGSQVKADFINGQIFSYWGYMGANVDWLQAFYENNPGAELAVADAYAGVEPGVVENPQLRADNAFGMIVGFSSYATEEELKAAWMYMEWMSQEDVLFTMENGVEGVTYTLGENGLPIVDGEYRGEEMLNHNNNIDMTCIVHASKVSGTIEDSITAITPQGIPQDLYEDLYTSWQQTKEIAENGWAYTDPVFATSIEAESEYSQTLLNLYKEYSVKLIKCDPSEFDALYEKLAQDYLNAGYQEIIDERLDAYEAGMTTKLPF